MNEIKFKPKRIKLYSHSLFRIISIQFFFSYLADGSYDEFMGFIHGLTI